MNKHTHLNDEETHVYMWEAPSRKRYVGVTNNIHRRCGEYRRKTKAGSELPIHRAIRKYGDQMKFSILFTETGKGARQRALDAEALLVEFGNFDLNAAPGGQESPSTRPEVAKKISKATTYRMSFADAREKVGRESLARWENKKYREHMAHKMANKASPSAEVRKTMGASQSLRFALGIGTQALEESRKKQMKPIVCIELSKEFGSISDAVRWLKDQGKTKADVSALTRAANGKVKSAYGHTWKFIEKEMT